MITRPMTELLAAGAIGYGAARVLGADRQLGPAVAIALWASAYVPGLPPGPGRLMGQLTGAIAGAVNPDGTSNGAGAGTADDPIVEDGEEVEYWEGADPHRFSFGVNTGPGGIPGSDGKLDE